MKLGIIVRGDNTGLGNQMRNLTYMLKPDKILYINSKPFNNNKQHYEWYENFTGVVSDGFPDNNTIQRFMNGLTHILTAETFYSFKILELANQNGIKTFNQVNYEFCDHLQHDLPLPYKWLMPSYWKLKEMTEKFENVKYLPPPLFSNDFKEAREINLKRTGKKRFVHVVGKQAVQDRNGTEDLLESLKYTNSDFELVIQSQYPLDYVIEDRRITYDFTDKKEPCELYKDFDAMILPRRYGGLCLPMNEALVSGLPVIMTDISPNKDVLPDNWLVQTKVKDQLMTRVMLDVYESDYHDLANKIDYFVDLDDDEMNDQKQLAFEIGYENYEADNLREKYYEILEL